MKIILPAKALSRELRDLKPRDIFVRDGANLDTDPIYMFVSFEDKLAGVRVFNLRTPQELVLENTLEVIHYPQAALHLGYPARQ